MGGRAARWSVAVWKAFAMAGSVGGMEFDYAGLRWFADLGVSNDAATAFGGTDGVERSCGDMAEGFGQLGGVGSGGGGKERLAARRAPAFLGGRLWCWR